MAVLAASTMAGSCRSARGQLGGGGAPGRACRNRRADAAATTNTSAPTRSAQPASTTLRKKIAVPSR